MQSIDYRELIAFACENQEVRLVPPLDATAAAAVEQLHRGVESLPLSAEVKGPLFRVVGTALRALADAYVPED